MRRLANRWLWPEVSYHEIAVGGETIRAKVATMPLDTFARAAAGETLDTTIWVRFGQPSALVWVRDDARSEEHTSELQSLMRISYAVSWLKNNNAKVYA